MQQTVRRYRVPLQAIGYVRMIMDGYDGVAVVVSPDAKHGIIEWWIAPGREAEADTLAEALRDEVGLTAL